MPPTTSRDTDWRDTERRQMDRLVYLDEVRIQMALSRDSRGMHAVVANVITDAAYGRYAERRAAIYRRGYEQMGVELAELAAEAAQQGGTYFELITGEEA